MDLSNRDIAFLLASSAAALWAVGTRVGRGIVRPLCSGLFAVAPWVAAFAGYFVLVVVVFQQRGLWTTELLKETIAWFLIGGLLLMRRIPLMYEDPPRFRAAVLKSLGITAVLEIALGLVSFSLAIEIALLAIAGFLGILTVGPAADATSKSIQTGAARLLAGLGLCVLIGTGLVLANEWNDLDKPRILSSIALSIWATLAALPFVFLVELHDKYSALFSEVDRRTSDNHSKSTAQRAKVALLLSFHLRGRALHTFAPFDVREVVKADNLAQARRIIAFQQAESQLKRATTRAAEARLARYAGIPGTDSDGQALDQREFEPTKRALELLAMVQRNQFGMHGRYSTETAQLLAGLPLRSLPPDPRIVIAVAGDAQAWSAWRRTIGGWYVAVGASEPPPDRWKYIGSEPPAPFPTIAAGWQPGTFDDW